MAPPERPDARVVAVGGDQLAAVLDGESGMVGIRDEVAAALGVGAEMAQGLRSAPWCAQAVLRLVLTLDDYGFRTPTAVDQFANTVLVSLQSVNTKSSSEHPGAAMYWPARYTVRPSTAAAP